MEGENLFNTFWHSVIPLQLFGTSPISLQRKKQAEYHVSKIGVAYISVLIGFFAYCGYLAFYNVNYIFENGQLVVLIFHVETRVILGPICSVLLLITSLTNARTACRVISGFAEFSTAMPHHFSPVFYRFTFFGSAAIFIIFLTLSCVQSYVEFENVTMMAHGNLTWLYFWSLYVSWVGFDIVSWAIITQLLIYTGMLYYQFRALEIEAAGDLRKAKGWKSFRNSLKILSNRGSFMANSPKNMKNLRHLHNHLTCVAADLNDLFATQILVFISCNTVLLCFALFVLLLSLETTEGAPSLRVSFLWFCIRILPIYLTIYPFSCIKRKVSENILLKVWL